MLWWILSCFYGKYCNLIGPFAGFLVFLGLFVEWYNLALNSKRPNIVCTKLLDFPVNASNWSSAEHINTSHYTYSWWIVQWQHGILYSGILPLEKLYSTHAGHCQQRIFNCLNRQVFTIWTRTSLDLTYIFTNIKSCQPLFS